MTEQSPNGPSFEKRTYKGSNEPYKIMGVVDWRLLLIAFAPASFCGLFTHSRGAGMIVTILITYLIAKHLMDLADEDPQWPLVFLKTFREKRSFCPFRKSQGGAPR